MKKYLLDTSYFLNMKEYYPTEDKKFDFIWEKLKEKIRNGEIIIIDKVFNELKEGKDNKFIQNFLEEFKEYKFKTDEEDNVPIVKAYEDNEQDFKGNFERFTKESSADLSLIGTAKKLDASILTDEIMPGRPEGTKSVKLNIPSLAEKVGVECFELRGRVNIILGEKGGK